MIELHLPWLELSILLPLVGALWIARTRDAELAQSQCVTFSALTLAGTIGAWQDFRWVTALRENVAGIEAHDHWDVLARLFGADVFVIDRLSAPLLPMAALLYLLTCVATLRTKVRRTSFSWLLVSEAILLATLSCKAPWGVIALLIAGTIPPFVELRSRGKSTRVYVVHMATFAVLLVAGQALLLVPGPRPVQLLGVAMLSGAALLRSGIVPVHCWLTDLFEKSTFGTALLFVTPMVGAYAAVRLVLPIAPEWALASIAFMSLFTAVYAAGMALVQREARRFFCYLFLSHSSLVLVGLETASPIGLTGALCLWLSVGLALGGLGLTLRSMEARAGRISLTGHHGLHEHTPTLAAFFLLTGLASVGFPGTFGFVGAELLVDGVLHPRPTGTFVEHVYPYAGVALVIAAALNGIAIVQAYFRILTGTRRTASIPLTTRPAERVAVLVLTLLILGGGLWPQPGIASRYRAAVEIVELRASLNAREGVADGGVFDAPAGSRRPSQRRGAFAFDSVFALKESQETGR